MRPRDVEFVQHRRHVRQQVVHDIARERQVVGESTFVMHFRDEARVLDGRGDRRGIDADHRLRRVVVSGRSVRPEIERPAHPAARADQWNDQPRPRQRTPFADAGLIVQRERLAMCQHPADHTLVIERRTHLDRRRIDAPARQAVRHVRPGRIHHVDAGRVVLDERSQTVENAVQDARRVGGVGREAEHLDHDARRIDGIAGDLGGRPGKPLR